MTTPVSPMPPAVAQNTSRRSAVVGTDGQHARRGSPTACARPSRRSEPCRNLPWMSEAIAPPTVTCAYRARPSGTSRGAGRRASASRCSRPPRRCTFPWRRRARARGRAGCTARRRHRRSARRRRSCGRGRAGSRRARRRASERRPARSSRRGSHTAARLGAVRPQPVRTSWPASQPPCTATAKHTTQTAPIASSTRSREHELFGRAALALVEQQRVAQDAERERDDRELEPGRRADRSPTSRTPRGSTRGWRRSTRPHARTRGSASVYPSSDRRWLAASVPSDRSSALRLPVTMNSDPAPATIRNHGEIDNADGDAAGDGAQHEAARDRGEVEHRLVLEPDAVRDGQHEVAADDERELPARGERQHDGEDRARSPPTIAV